MLPFDMRKVGSMRSKCRLGAALVGIQLTCGVAAVAAEPPQGTHSPEVQASVAATPVLSPQAEQVSQIAKANGDKEFLMIDKARGEIILFQDDRPTYSGPALTGASMADRVPPKVLALSGNHPLTAAEKVTPSGRFTVRPEADPEFGRVWTINEIHGKDWDFAIHQVYLGIPSEHRDARIHSTDPAAHHITFGCINVERSTVQFLTRELPKKASVPLYILPQDEGLTATLFPIRVQRSASK